MTCTCNWLGWWSVLQVTALGWTPCPFSGLNLGRLPTGNYMSGWKHTQSQFALCCSAYLPGVYKRGCICKFVGWHSQREQTAGGVADLWGNTPMTKRAWQPISPCLSQWGRWHGTCWVINVGPKLGVERPREHCGVCPTTETLHLCEKNRSSLLFWVSMHAMTLPRYWCFTFPNVFAWNVKMLLFLFLCWLGFGCALASNFSSHFTWWKTRHRK